MDDGSPASTVERTFWTVWNYITGAVSRFFRSEPINVVRNDPNSLKEPTIDGEPAKSGHTEGDTSAREGDEEQHLASVSVQSLSRPVVAWKLCTTDIDLGPPEESAQYKTQLSTGSESKEPEEDEGMREEQFGQTRSNEAETLITDFTKENEQKENGVQNTHGQDETQENDEYEEDVNSRSLSLTRDVVSEYMEESGNKAGAEEETERVKTPDDQKMDETMTKEEEGDEDEDKQCLEEEDIEMKLCRIKDLSLEEEGNMFIEETRVQRVEVDTAVTLEEVENSDGVLLLASENENKSDEGAKKAENQPSVCEELSDDHRDFVGEPILTSQHVELQMTCDKSAIVSEDELIVVAQEHAMAHGGESDKVEDAKKEEDESTLREQGAVFQEESANEAANKQIIYEVLEQEDNIKSVKEESQEKHISTGHVTCSEEVVQNAQTQLHTIEFADGDQEDVAKDTEVQTKTETDDVETEGHGKVIDVKSGMTTTDISVDEKFFDKDQREEERLSSAREGDEEQHLASGSVPSLSQSVVALKLCTTDIDLGPHEESTKYKTQLSTGSESKEPEQDEGMREEQFGQTRSNEAETLITDFTKKNEQEENGVQNTHGQDETQENDEYEEDVNSRSLSLTGDAVSEYMEESGNKAGAEEETERVKTPDDHQKMDETMTKEEEGDEDEDKQCLEEEDIEMKLCRIKDLSLEEEGNMFIEETRVQRVEVDTAVTLEEVENSDGVLLLASENENKSDEGAKKAENQPSVCEELSDDHRDFIGEPILTSQHAELQMTCNKSAIVSEDEFIVVAQEHAMAHGGESDKVEDAKKEEDESTLREQGAVFQEESANEAANKQIIYEVLEQEDNIKSVKEESQEKHISTGHVTCSEEVVQNAQTQLHTIEFADGDQEDVAKDTEVQTKTETDDVEAESHGELIDVKSGMTTDISVDERFFDKDQREEEKLSSEEGNKESYMEVACTTTSVTVKPEGETRQEISGEFKNISLEMCEGQLVLSQELNSPTCEETQEGVPECNNESGPDENTTQWFLEVDWKEIPATQLPEEVESKEPECLQNSGWNTDDLLVREYMEEEQDHTVDIKNSFDLVVEEHTEVVQLTEAGLPQETEKTLVEPVIQESGVLFGDEEENIFVASMKTGIEYSEKEFEPDVGLTDDTHKTTKELQDGTEELLVEFEIDEVSCDSKEADTARDGHETTGYVAAQEVVTVETLKFPKAEVQNEREMGFFQESVDAINSDPNSYRTTSLQEDLAESGFLEQLVESDLKLLEDSTVEMQDAGIDLQEEEAAEDGVQNKNEMEISNLHVAGLAAEVTTERSEKENTLTVESLETQELSGEEALELSSAETETGDKSITAESKPEDLIVISAEEMEKHVTESEQSRIEQSCAEESVSSINERQDVIDEEILDLWIQTVSEDADDVKQQERSEPGHQMDTERESSNKDQGGISSVQTEKDEEQLVESYSGESELVSDTEMSSSTAESGFLDQSVGEWGTQNSETQLLKSTSTGSVQGVYDMLANMSESADISAQLNESNSESQDILMEETTETGQSYLKEEESITETEFHPDSGVESSETRHLDEESDQSQEKTDEEETGSQTEIDVDDHTRKTDWKEPGEADIKSITEMSIIFKVEETKAEDEPLETTMSDSPDEHTKASLVKGIVLTESCSEEKICAESEETLLNLPSLDQPEPKWSENIVDSLPGLNRTDMAEQPMTESEDQMEVDAFVLDFTAQRSRIAVKNPRVRPPKDPRSLLHMPSLEPTPSTPVKVRAGVPLGGMGIGIKLPGLGAGFPVLKKTPRAVRDENSQTTLPQEPEPTKPMETSDTPKQDEVQRKPKWMPPGHSGFGNPLMSELKSKLKKTTKE